MKKYITPYRFIQFALYALIAVFLTGGLSLILMASALVYDDVHGAVKLTVAAVTMVCLGLLCVWADGMIKRTSSKKNKEDDVS